MEILAPRTGFLTSRTMESPVISVVSSMISAPTERKSSLPTCSVVLSTLSHTLHIHRRSRGDTLLYDETTVSSYSVTVLKAYDSIRSGRYLCRKCVHLGRDFLCGTMIL